MTHKRRWALWILGIGLLLIAAWLIFKHPSVSSPDSNSSGQTTQQSNADLLARLPFDDKADSEDAKRGFSVAVSDATLNATVSTSRETWNLIALKKIGFPLALAKGKVKVDGSLVKVIERFGLLDDFTPDFEVVEPLTKQK